MKLSDNLSLAEVIKSNTAIKYGIDNSPTEEHLENLKAIAQDVFQPHVFGGMSNGHLFNYIEDQLVFDQLIWEFGTSTEPDWVHVSYKKEGKNRGQKLVAYKKDGKTRYKEI